MRWRIAKAGFCLQVAGCMPNDFSDLIAAAELTADQCREVAAWLVDGAVADEAKAQALLAWARRGESPAEIAVLVEAFLQRALDPGLDVAALPGPMLDVVGTGGDGLHLFNVSTTAMFILAASGVCVTKHGNRGVTSKAGGADVLEALGVAIDLPAPRVAAGMAELGLGFFFAPLYHPAFKAVAGARRLLAAQGQRSVFNMLGPLLNPARPAHQLIGVFSPALLPVFGQILQRLGRRAAWVVHGEVPGHGGMDEFSSLGGNEVCALKDGKLASLRVDPRELGLAPAQLADLVGGDAAHNAGLVRAILQGQDRGPRADIALLNAAAGLVVVGKAAAMPEGLALARQALESGAAAAKLEALAQWR
jgi:anthranilate phosphoribosyltransferase